MDSVYIKKFYNKIITIKKDLEKKLLTNKYKIKIKHIKNNKKTINLNYTLEKFFREVCNWQFEGEYNFFILCYDCYKNFKESEKIILQR